MFDPNFFRPGERVKIEEHGEERPIRGRITNVTPVGLMLEGYDAGEEAPPTPVLIGWACIRKCWFLDRVAGAVSREEAPHWLPDLGGQEKPLVAPEWWKSAPEKRITAEDVADIQGSRRGRRRTPAPAEWVETEPQETPQIVVFVPADKAQIPGEEGAEPSEFRQAFLGELSDLKKKGELYGKPDSWR